MPSQTACYFRALFVTSESDDAHAGAILADIGQMAVANVGLIAAVSPGQTLQAFLKAGALGCTHVVALSASGNYSREDFAAMMLASERNPTALIVGSRRARQSRPGLFLRASALFLRLETGHRLRREDMPRIYPVQLLQAIDPTGARCFGEIEILVRSTWAGCPIVIVPLPPAAVQPKLRRPVAVSPRQKFRELTMHVRLLARALSGLSNPKYLSASAPAAAAQPFWPMFWRWLNPFDAWRELRKGGASRHEMAVGLAVGAFIGNLPAWGFHTGISLYVARRLHLNPLAVMTGSHVSAPPMGPILVYSAMWTGHVILHQARPRWEDITPFDGKFMAHALPLLLDWTLGAVLVGTAVAILVYLIGNFLFRFVEKPPAENALGVDA